MADMDPKPIGMMNSASRFYNDNIPATSPLKKVIEGKLQKRYAGRPLMSQYTPKEGELEQFQNDKIARMVEEDMLLNQMAASKGAENLTDAMMFAGGVMGAVEGMNALKGFLKNAPLPKGNPLANSTIYNKNTGMMQSFDELGLESRTMPRKQILNPDYTDMGNSYLQNNNPFVPPTNESTLKNIKAFGGRSSKMPKK